MKISKYKDTKFNNYANDPNKEFLRLINDLSEQYGQVYTEKIDDELFIYRVITRKEYRELLDRVKDSLIQENVICESCVVYPEDYDFDNCAAGIPTILAKKILENSCLDSIDSMSNVIQFYRIEMLNNFDNQINCIISEAFPNLSMTEIENFDMQTTAKYIADAEYKLAVIRNVPFDAGKLILSMRQDWNQKHPDQQVEVNYDPNMQVQAGVQEMAQQEMKRNIQQGEPAKQNVYRQPEPQPVQNQPRVDNFNDGDEKLADSDLNAHSKRKFIHKETLEERQKRVIKEGPVHYSQQEVANAMRKNPTINWAAEDYQHKTTEADYKYSIETDPVALRTPRQD